MNEGRAGTLGARQYAVEEHEGSYFESGLRLIEDGDYDGAVTLFDNALRLGLGDMAAIRVCRAEALVYLGAWAEAEADIEAALGMKPYLAAAYLARGNLRRLQGKIDEAINDFTTAIHIEPTDDEAYFNRAGAYADRRRHADAEADLTRALQLNPGLGGAYEARGRCRAAQFKFDLAIEDIAHYLRSGAGREFDNHSEMQGYLLILRVKRLVWGLLSRWRRG